MPLSAPPMTAFNDGPVPEGDPAAPFSEATATAVNTSAPTSTLSLLALDRKAMEAERLARRQKALEAQIARTGTSATSSTAGRENNLQQNVQHDAQPEAQHLERSWELPWATKKRKAEDDVIVIDSDDDHVDEKQTVTKRDGNSHHPPSRRRLDEDNLERERGKQVNPPAQIAQTLTLPTHLFGASTLPVLLPYARGVVKKTWVRGQPRLDDDVTIDEIWQKKHLELAVLSSFQWDEDWLAVHLDFQRTRVMLIAYAADDCQVCHSQGHDAFFFLDSFRSKPRLWIGRVFMKWLAVVSLLWWYGGCSRSRLAPRGTPRSTFGMPSGKHMLLIGTSVYPAKVAANRKPLSRSLSSSLVDALEL